MISDHEDIEPSQPLPRLISIKQAAVLLGRTDRTMRRWIADGTLPLVRIGRGKFILLDDVQALIQDQIADQAINQIASGRLNSIKVSH